MISHISIEEFVDILYKPVHGHRSVYAKGLVKRLRNAGITDLRTLVKTTPETLQMVKYIGPVFIAQSNDHLANIDCHLGMTDDELKEVILSKL